MQGNYGGRGNSVLTVGGANATPRDTRYGGYNGTSPSTANRRFQDAGGQQRRSGPPGGNRRFNPNGGATSSGQSTHGQSQRWTPGARSQQRGARPQPSQPSMQRRPDAPVASGAAGGDVDRFELFCAYHLGITADGSYRIQNIHEVARRFGTNAAALKQTLTAYGMDADDMVHSGFDLASAQIDIMVAPEGVSRKELARPLYDEFLQTPRKARNWAKEMEEADRAIAGTLGRDGRWSPGARDPSGKQS